MSTLKSIIFETLPDPRNLKIAEEPNEVGLSR